MTAVSDWLNWCKYKRGRDNPIVSEVPALNVEGAVPSRLPVLPLKSTVVFPRIFIPLSVGRKRSLQLLEDLAGGGGPHPPRARPAQCAGGGGVKENNTH